jgi:hypothetical protein
MGYWQCFGINNYLPSIRENQGKLPSPCTEIISAGLQKPPAGKDALTAANLGAGFVLGDFVALRTRRLCRLEAP